jgi:hypothetical protein
LSIDFFNIIRMLLIQFFAFSVCLIRSRGCCFGWLWTCDAEQAATVKSHSTVAAFFCTITADKGSTSGDLLFIYSFSLFRALRICIHTRISLSSFEKARGRSARRERERKRASAVTSFINSKRNCVRANNTMSLPITLAVTLTKRCQNGTPK